MKVSLYDCVNVLIEHDKGLYDFKSSLCQHGHDIDSLRSDVRKLHDALSFKSTNKSVKNGKVK